MARLNIEDSLFKDDRWSNLILKTGDRHRALGLLINAWTIAQKHWLKLRCVPKQAWSKDLDILIEVEFAIRLENGDVYVKGSKKAFLWLDQKSEAGQKISEKKTEALKKARFARWNKSIDGVNESERNIDGSEAPTLTPFSSSLLSSLPHAHTQTQIQERINTSTRVRKKPNPLNGEIWEAYRDAYGQRYGHDPIRNASVNSKISQIAQRLGPEGIEVVRFFVSHNDAFYLKQLHSIGLCLKDAEALYTQWKRGKPVTSNDVRAFEKTDAFRAQWDRMADKNEP